MYMYKLFDFVLTFISETKIYVVNLELYPFNFVVTFILETKKNVCKSGTLPFDFVLIFILKTKNNVCRFRILLYYSSWLFANSNVTH